MSVPPQQKASSKRTGKRITFFSEQGVAMKDPAQQQGAEGPFSNLGPTPSERGRSEASGQVSSSDVPHMYNSVIFSPEKGGQRRGHYQQTVPTKWAPQDPLRQASWTQPVPVDSWQQNVGSYLEAVGMGDSRIQTVFPKASLQEQQLQHPSVAPEKQLSGSLDAYRDSAKVSGLDWEQQTHAQAQPLQQSLVQLPSQPPAISRATTSSVLQPFQVAFGPSKQHLPHGFYQVFQANRGLPNLGYAGQPKSQNQFLLHQQHQGGVHQHQEVKLQRQEQQQQLHVQLHQQQSQQHHQPQHQLIQHKQQEMHEMQQFMDFLPSTSMPNTHANPQLQAQPTPALGSHTQLEGAKLPVGSSETDAQKLLSNPQQPFEVLQAAPRRSRRLSKEGAPASSHVAVNRLAQGPQGSLNGNSEGRKGALEGEVQAAPVGVIKSTHRKRRASQEVNLETLAQKASEMESLPSQSIMGPRKVWSCSGDGVTAEGAERPGAKRSRDESMPPLVIPVSVPVQPSDQDPARTTGSWSQRPLGLHDSAQAERKPSVIVTRRRSLRNSLSENPDQNGDGEEGRHEDGKSGKTRRRPRPQPLFIPSPKTGTFIAPPVYSNITPYQSHLRSPVRLADNPVVLPPYTPPPILSPVREGSGLYFSTFMSTSVGAAQGAVPLPPATPKSATRSLIRSASCDVTPPVLCAVNEATPVSIEPRINIGLQYQAEVPELQDAAGAQYDQHRAELVWAPLHESGSANLKRVDDLMHLACSSALTGGGTNQELVLHCLYECKGDFLETLALLLLKQPIFSKTHPLSDYHYSGSDSWTSAERRFFNKGLAAYKKDFFMVQKVVSTKTVAQCVEFYYTYKKQVKVGRSGTLVYGDAEPPEPWAAEVERFEPRREEVGRSWEELREPKRESSPARITQLLQASENAGAVLVLRSTEEVKEEVPHVREARSLSPAPAPPKPRADPTRKNGPTGVGKGHSNQEGEFPCKKCGRVFYKVKSRSAHMKSHAEQEKKAAALRQKEAEQRAAAAAAMAAEAASSGRQNGTQGGDGSSSSEGSSAEGEDADDEDWH